MLAVIDRRMSCTAKSRLQSMYDVVELPPFSELDERVASHPDMLIFKLDKKLFVCQRYYKEAAEQIDRILKHASLELHLTDDTLSHEYPNDIKFNVFTLKDALIGRSEYISEKIKVHAQELGIRLVNTNQGYAKCSAIVLKNALISADKGLCNIATSLGCDALHVSAGGVLLNGYDYGFIGGASGVYQNKVFFCGNIYAHADFDKISLFCKSHGYEIISLSDEPLYDVGTILFF